MKWFKNLFKKRNVKLGFHLVTAGTDTEGRHSVCFQEVNDVWCICVYKCDGKHLEKEKGYPCCNMILIFPTEEMRDAFYENFKEEIESCKELL